MKNPRITLVVKCTANLHIFKCSKTKTKTKQAARSIKGSVGLKWGRLEEMTWGRLERQPSHTVEEQRQGLGSFVMTQKQARKWGVRGNNWQRKLWLKKSWILELGFWASHLLQTTYSFLFVFLFCFVFLLPLPFHVFGLFVLKIQAFGLFLLSLDGTVTPKCGRADWCLKKQYKEYIFLLKTSWFKYLVSLSLSFFFLSLSLSLFYFYFFLFCFGGGGLFGLFVVIAGDSCLFLTGKTSSLYSYFLFVFSRLKHLCLKVRRKIILRNWFQK